MSDIYNINNWATSTTYNVDDIVLQNNIYYYCTERHTSGTFATDLTAGKWNGTVTVNGQSKPFFFWKPSYNYSLDIKPAIKSIKFGDGFEQTLGDGINNILLSITLQFNERGLGEYSAILHFLHTRAGFEQFYFIPPQPFGVLKKFTCPNWRPTQNFYENYSLEAEFQEKV